MYVKKIVLQRICSRNPAVKRRDSFYAGHTAAKQSFKSLQKNEKTIAKHRKRRYNHICFQQRETFAGGIAEYFYHTLLFRVMEIHRICEVTATPSEEGANLSECGEIRAFEQ